MDYKICVCTAFFFHVQTPSFYAKFRLLYANVSVILSKWPGFYTKVLVWVCTCEWCPVRPSWGGCCVCKACFSKLVGGVDLNGWGCAGVRRNILAQETYCAKRNPEPDSQSGSRVCKGIGNQAPQSIQEYDLETTIEIHLLTQLLTYEMVYSVFAATSRLKVASTTWASLTITPSTKRTKGEHFRCLWQFCPCLYFLIFSHLCKIVSIPYFL